MGCLLLASVSLVLGGQPDLSAVDDLEQMKPPPDPPVVSRRTGLTACPADFTQLVTVSSTRFGRRMFLDVSVAVYSLRQLRVDAVTTDLPVASSSPTPGGGGHYELDLPKAGMVVTASVDVSCGEELRHVALSIDARNKVTKTIDTSIGHLDLAMDSGFNIASEKQNLGVTPLTRAHLTAGVHVLTVTRMSDHAVRKLTVDVKPGLTFVRTEFEALKP